MKKENGGFDCYFKTAAWPHFGQKHHLPQLRFFYYRSCGSIPL
ncbi:hypothetical protein [Clostridium botulinum]|nr:hypothetical protein [Clostridium botulinum]